MKTTNKIELVSGAVRRTLYLFKCSKCGNDRQSVYKEFADLKVCRNCRSKHINENQQSMFGSIKSPDGAPLPYIDIKTNV